MRLPLVFILFLALVCQELWALQEQPASVQAPREQPTAGQLPELSPRAAALQNTVVIPEATPVKLRLLHSLNSKAVVVDDPLNFAVAEDVIVNGKIAAKAGSTAIGRVRQAKPARMLGRGAQLVLDMQYLKVGRVRVPLRGSQARSGENKKAETTALVVLFGLSGLVKHGSEIEVKEGSVFTAYVDQDTELPLQPEAQTQIK